jgi:HSP20 family molecular chaperone IbpA
MNALTRWSQLKQLEALQHGLGSLFKDGVLTVHLAKTVKAKPQHIEVKVA